MHVEEQVGWGPRLANTQPFWTNSQSMVNSSSSQTNLQTCPRGAADDLFSLLLAAKINLRSSADAQGPPSQGEEDSAQTESGDQQKWKQSSTVSESCARWRWCNSEGGRHLISWQLEWRRRREELNGRRRHKLDSLPVLLQLAHPPGPQRPAARHRLGRRRLRLVSADRPPHSNAATHSALAS